MLEGGNLKSSFIFCREPYLKERNFAGPAETKEATVGIESSVVRLSPSLLSSDI